MSNLLSIHNSKNQVGIGTNIINVSSDLTIKENTRRYIVCNTNNNSLAVHRTIELEDETTLSTVKTHNISSAKLLYVASNNIISSLALSSSNYLKISNTGGLGLVDKTAPNITLLSIASNNSTTTLAKAGDEVTLTITTNEPILTPSVTFTSGSASITNSSFITNESDTSWIAKYTVHSNDTDGIVGFSLTVTDSSGNQTTSSTTTDSSSVLIDTTAPNQPGVSFPTTDQGIWPNRVVVTTNDSWEYSINSGLSYSVGSGSYFTLPASGTYVPGGKVCSTYSTGTIRVRTKDTAGNVSGYVSNTQEIKVYVLSELRTFMKQTYETDSTKCNGWGINKKMSIFIRVDGYNGTTLAPPPKNDS